MTHNDRRSALFSSYEHAARIIENISPADLDRHTPCAAFNVAALVSHSVGAAWRAAALGRGDALAEEFPDVALSEAPERVRQAKQEAEAAWGDEERLVARTTMPWDETYSGAALVDMYVMELATHAWDLAMATDQVHALDPSAPVEALACANEILLPAYRNAEGFPFGFEVPAPENATPWEQLAAFMGRQPRPAL